MSRFAKGFKVRPSGRTFAKNFALGFSGPFLLLNPMPGPRALERGETVRHAWRTVGEQMKDGLKKVADERSVKTF